MPCISAANAPGHRSLVLHAASGAASASSDSPNMGAVLTAVGVACMGAFAFGYHLGVVNGPLEQIAKDIGIAGNKALIGLVSISCFSSHREV